MIKTSMKSCKHEGAEVCSYVKLRKEKSKDIAKRLSRYVDRRYANATEDRLRYTVRFWENEGLLYEFHGSFIERIAMMARDMRIEPEIEMVPLLTQRYFLWVKEHESFAVRDGISDAYLEVYIRDMGMNLHRKTKRLISENIESANNLVTISDVRNTKEMDLKIREFILKKPRQRSITGTREIYSGWY